MKIARVFEIDLRAESNAQAARANVRRARTRRDAVGSVVYYAHVGEFIKIGVTTNLRHRLSTLRATSLLAVEPGGREVERQRHLEWARFRTHPKREDFSPAEELLVWTDRLRAATGLPNWYDPARWRVTVRQRDTLDDTSTDT